MKLDELAKLWAQNVRKAQPPAPTPPETALAPVPEIGGTADLHPPEGDADPSPPASPPEKESAPLALTREQRRSRRKRAIRGRTISMKRMTKMELSIGKALYPERPGVDYTRPTNRTECRGGERPCPFVSCQHHLYLDVQRRTGAVKLNFPDLEVWEMNESCALDVADRGETTLEGVGAILNLTRERIRQLEVRALARLERLRATQAMGDDIRDPRARRRLPVLVEEPDDEEDEDDAAPDDEDE
jgi:hypothetical protein